MLKLFPFFVFIIIVGVFMTSCQKTANIPQAPDLSENQQLEISDPAKTNVIDFTKITEPYEATLCPDDFPGGVECLSECIQFSGTLNVVAKQFEDGHKGFHLMSNVNLKNCKGVGLTTDTEYINAWKGTWNHHYGNLDWETYYKTPPCKWHITYTDRYISKGKTPNFKITWDMQIVINANEEMTVNTNIMEVTCY